MPNDFRIITPGKVRHSSGFEVRFEGRAVLVYEEPGRTARSDGDGSLTASLDGWHTPAGVVPMPQEEEELILRRMLAGVRAMPSCQNFNFYWGGVSFDDDDECFAMKRQRTEAFDRISPTEVRHFRGWGVKFLDEQTVTCYEPERWATYECTRERDPNLLVRPQHPPLPANMLRVFQDTLTGWHTAQGTQPMTEEDRRTVMFYLTAGMGKLEGQAYSLSRKNPPPAAAKFQSAAGTGLGRYVTAVANLFARPKR